MFVNNRVCYNRVALYNSNFVQNFSTYTRLYKVPRIRFNLWKTSLMRFVLKQRLFFFNASICTSILPNFNFFIFPILLLSLAISKYRQYFLRLQTLKLNNKIRKNSLFYEEKSLVGLTPVRQNALWISHIEMHYHLTNICTKEKNDFVVNLAKMTKYVQWANDYLRITTTCLQRTSFWNPDLNLYSINQPLNNDHLSTVATNFVVPRVCGRCSQVWL